MDEIDSLLIQVQASVAAAVKGASSASGAATSAMARVTHFATPGAGGPLDEMAHHVLSNAQSVSGMRAAVDKLEADLLILTQDNNTRMNPTVGLGRSFLGGAPFNTAPPVAPAVQGMVTSTEIARLTAMVADVKQLVNEDGFKTQSHDFKSYDDVVVFARSSSPRPSVTSVFPIFAPC